jgi:large subunit ribosomal protein L24
MHIRVDDQVEVMVGRDKSVRAKVLRMLRDEGKVVVEGVNTVWKHMRRSQKNPRGGRLHKEMPVQISNVQLVCPACNQATRTGVRFKDDGSKHRFCKNCSAEIGQLSPAKKRRAKTAGV